MSDGTDWCRHYQGVGKICKAGVDPKAVRMAQLGNSKASLYPCFEEDGVSALCSQCSYLTPDERIAEKERATAVWVKYVSDLDNNVCPFCGAAIVKQRQVGRCVYADPCGHRLYQGRAR